MRTLLSPKLLAVLELVAYVAVIAVNALANALPINGLNTGELSDLYPNLFVPSGFTFSIWAAIYLLMGAYVVYRLVKAFGAGSGGAFQEVGMLFMVSCVFNVGWILAWHYMLIPLSVLIMLSFLATLAWTFLRLRYPSASLIKGDNYLVVPFFSVYLGWITIASVANVTTLLVDLGWRGGSLGEPFWTIVMIGVATALGLVMLWKHLDVFYSLVLVWAFFGIYAKRSAAMNPEENIVLSLYLFSGVLILGIAYAIWRRLVSC